MATILCTVLLSLSNSLSLGEGQLLRRYVPQTSSHEISKPGLGDISVELEKTIPVSDMEVIVTYISDKFRNPAAGDLQHIDIYQVPLTADLYFVIAGYTTESIFLLRKHEAEITEMNRISNDVGCGGWRGPTFFIGTERALMVISYNAEDGAFCGNYAFETEGEILKPLGSIPVYDGVHGPGVWQGHSPMDKARAEYRNNTYYVTMRGEGSLYLQTKDSFDGKERDKKLALPKSPITFFFDGQTWRSLNSNQIRRR